MYLNAPVPAEPDYQEEIKNDLEGEVEDPVIREMLDEWDIGGGR